MKSTHRRKTIVAAAALAAGLTGATPVALAGLNAFSGGGPDGGRVTRLLQDTANANRLYALGQTAGMFVSDDAGASWAPLPVVAPDIAEISLVDMALDPNAPTTIFAVDGGSEVARSLDGGATWTSSSNGLPGSIYNVYADPNTSGIVYVTASGQVLKSTDNGDTFADASNGLGLSIVTELLLVSGDAGLIYAAGWEGIYKSIDGGATWNPANNGLPPPNASGYRFANVGAIDPLNSDIAYVNISNNGVYKTIDGGASWSFSGQGMPGDFFTRMIIDPTDTNRIFLASGNNDVVASANAGATWGNLPNVGLGDYTVDDLILDQSGPTRLFAGTFTKGIFVSTDLGSSWQSSTAGYVNNDVESLSVDAASGRIYAGTFGGTASSGDDGVSWQSNGGDYDLTSFAIQADPLLASHAYAGSSCCGLYESFDDGLNWARIDLQLPVFATWVTDIDIPEGDTQRLYFSDFNRGLFGSTDGGQTWSHLNPGLQPFFSGNVVLTGVDAVANSPATIYVCSSDFSSGGVFRSDDSGASWARVAGSGVGGPTRVSSIAVHPDDPQIVYAGRSTSGVQYSLDGGVTWQSPTQNIAGEVKSVFIDQDDPQILYAVSRTTGLYRSIDGGDEWTPALDSIANNFNALTVDPDVPSRVLVGIDAKGFREYTFATDLSLAVQASDTSADPGNSITLDATLTNNGPISATGVTLSDAAPATFSVLSALPSQGSCDVTGQQIDCALGTLADGASASVSIVLEAVTAGSGDYASLAGAREADTQPGDNSASIGLTVTGDTDTDGDGVGDSTDNCLLVANASQLDGDGDGYGNACDADLNNDCIVNVLDLGLLKLVFFTADAGADFNGDGIVNVIDLGIMKTRFFGAPGPAQGGFCE